MPMWRWSFVSPLWSSRCHSLHQCAQITSNGKFSHGVPNDLGPLHSIFLHFALSWKHSRPKAIILVHEFGHIWKLLPTMQRSSFALCFLIARSDYVLLFANLHCLMTVFAVSGLCACQHSNVLLVFSLDAKRWPITEFVWTDAARCVVCLLARWL